MKKIFLILFCTAFLFAAEEEQSPRFIVHILDYLAIDYPGAVQNGKVIEAAEYAEQVEFAKEAIRMVEAIPTLKGNQELVSNLKKLQSKVLAKADEKEIAELSRVCEKIVISSQGIEMSPRKWPSLAKGKKHFEQNCAQCHGQTGHGDGPSGGSLDPKPADFHAARAHQMSPFQYYNSIRLGVPGTAMAAFPNFSDAEIWDLAFYAASLKYSAYAPSQASTEPLTLSALASHSDEALLADNSLGSSADKKLKLIQGRTYQASDNIDYQNLDFAKSQLVLSVTKYSQKDFRGAKEAAIAAYLEGIEPIEARLRNSDSNLTIQIEKTMADFRNGISQEVSVDRLEELKFQVDKKLEEARNVLANSKTSPWVIGSLAGGIFLREAFEAVLILITLLGVIRSIGIKGAAIYIHGGWIAAVLVGVVTWFFSGWLMQMSGATRELLEGIVSLMAVFILLYFGFWLHRKTEMGKWRAFINKTVETAVAKRRLIGLGFVAFMGVFREAFETVLFLRALLLEVGEAGEQSLYSGVAMSLLIVIISSAIAIRMSARLPIRQLFAVSSFVMAFLAFILIGKAVHSFQETGLIPMTHLPIGFRFDVLGIFPTYQTLLPQIVLLSVCLLFWWNSKQNLKKPA